jgi:hypothetical protein
MVNANYGYEHGSVVTSLCFHPTENILMTSGLDRKVKMFEVSHPATLLEQGGSDSKNNVKSS